MLNQEIEDSKWQSLTAQSSGIVYQPFMDTDTFYTYCTVPAADWKVVFLHYNKTFNNNTSRILSYNILITIVCVFFAFIIAVFISYAITKPLKTLNALMKRVENNDLDVTFVSNTNDEVSQLGESFNKMIRRIRQMLQTVYDAKLAERDATIYALQSQINPHFLYNTLQSIADIAISYDITEIPEMCANLSAMLRYSINNHKRFVRLYDEIENIRNYYNLQSTKYPGKFSLDVNIDADYYNVRIPRLILQPLIENSFTHGFVNIQDSYTISIVSRVESDNLKIVVSDNGQGISPDVLNDILESFHSDDAMHHTEKYLALNNVNRRLVLTYGSEYALAIESQPAYGTSITVTIPIIGYNKSQNDALFYLKGNDEHVSSDNN